MVSSLGLILTEYLKKDGLAVIASPQKCMFLLLESTFMQKDFCLQNCGENIEHDVNGAYL